MWISFGIIMLILFIMLWTRRDDHAIVLIGLMMVWMGYYVFPEHYIIFYVLGLLCLGAYITAWKRGVYSRKEKP